MDMSWLLQKRIVRVVNRLIESTEFSFGVRQMKAVCVAAGVEGGKHAVREQVVTRKFNPEEPSVFVEQTQAINDYVKDFMETKFVSYRRLGEMDLAGLCHLCRDSNTEGNPSKGSSLNVGPSYNPPGY